MKTHLLSRIQYLAVLCTLASVASITTGSPVFAAEKRWRTIVVNPPHLAKHGMKAPSIWDIAVGQENQIYIVTTTRALLRLEDEDQWVPADGRKLPLKRKKDGSYWSAQPEYKSIGKYDNAGAGWRRIKEPDRVLGIALRAAVDTDGRVWVVTQGGRVYRLNHDNTWEKMPVMASDVATGPDGAVVVWSMRSDGKEHAQWRRKHPHPKRWNGQSWEDIQNLPELTAMAFDAKGGLWVLTGDPGQPTSHKIMRQEGADWREVSGVPHPRYLESDLQGNLWALSFTTQRDNDGGWNNRKERVFRWSGSDWRDDPTIPDLHVKLRTKSPFFGTLMDFRDHLTWVSHRRWYSLKTVPGDDPGKTTGSARSSVETPKPFKVADSNWFGIIKPLDPDMPIDPEIKRLWGKGAYLHMRPDGALGFNWEAPSNYTYAVENRWLQDENTFVIQMGVFHYVFTLAPPNQKLVANLNNAFEMTIDRR